MHVTDLFFLGVRNHPHRLALSGDGGDFTYVETQALSNRIARRLRAAGLGVGHKFAVMSPNTSPALIAMLGGMRAGLAWCNLNMRAAIGDIIHILKAGTCHVVFMHSSAEPMMAEIRAAVPSLREIVCLDAASAHGQSLAAWLGDETDDPLDLRLPDTALGFQGATGGTTGRSKLTQADNRFVATCIAAWSSCVRFNEPPINLAVAPITHAAGFVALSMGQLGGTTVMMERPDLARMINLIAERHVSLLFLPPTLVYMMLAHPALATADTSSLRYLLVGAAPFAPEKVIQAVDRLGPVICQAYGQTESGFPLTFMPTQDVAEAVADPARRHRLLSCGQQTNIVEALEIMDDDGRILGPDQQGEVVMRGPTEMHGYLDDDAATAEIKKFGWLHTGDIGRRDADGYFYITDRTRDMIVSGGFNIFPFEVESALMEHASVQDCAVIGVPDEKWGEAVKACVQLKPGSNVGAEELIAFVKEKIGSMKTPKSVDFVFDLPRSPVGKVLKRELRAPYWQGRTRAVN
jgi:acyl-CoA synthetase (AMP-forming)/AMP-acid ligase II